MAKLDLTKYGITGVTEIVHNPSYEQLFEEETKAGLEGFEVGQNTELNAVNVMTGIYTGRSPKDKFIVMDENSKDTVWWTSDEYKNDNKPASQEAWAAVKEIAQKELSNKRLFVVDGFCGANKETRMAVRFIMEVAWQAHFVKNMFIRPTEEELAEFEPDFIVYNASKAKVENYKELGLNSETAVVFNVTSREQVIINTWYGGEMKKGMFSMMNYYLPLQGIASMHCSANCDMNGENTAIFFGRTDEHVLHEVSLPCHLHDEAHSHTGVFVSTAEAINNIKLLTREFLLSNLLNGSPGLLGYRLVIVLIFIRSPPYGIVRVLVIYDKLILR